MALSIYCWNVNGIRAAYPKGLGKLLQQGEAKNSPDILCLQEVKATHSEYPKELAELKDYKILHADSNKKGHSGVALFYKANLKLKWHHLGMGIPKFDNEGRIIIACFDGLILINGYFPNGRRDHSRVDFKLEFSRAIIKRALELKKEFKLPVAICGDFNTAHHPIDLKNPQANKNTTGFLPNERAFLDEIEQQGFIDIYRKRNPNKEGAYTWWTYRGDCRDRNIGWRLDYFWCTPDLMDRVQECNILTKISGSDHCPVELKIEN